MSYFSNELELGMILKYALFNMFALLLGDVIRFTSMFNFLTILINKPVILSSDVPCQWSLFLHFKLLKKSNQFEDLLTFDVLLLIDVRALNKNIPIGELSVRIIYIPYRYYYCCFFLST